MGSITDVLRPNTMVEAIIKQIATEADRLQEEVIKDAVARFERELRDRVARAAIRVQDHYDMASRDGHLIITVRHGGPDGKLQRN